MVAILSDGTSRFAASFSVRNQCGPRKADLTYAFGLTGVNSKLQQTVPNAWFYAGTNAYHNITNNHPVDFTVVGSDNCFGDTVSSFQQNPSGNLQYLNQNVYTPAP
jgi:hypothetical protein